MRVLALALASHATGLPLERLALYFDGHEYITVAQSFPLPYGKDLWLETAWLPGYPLAIALAFQVIGNYAHAALAVSLGASAAAPPLVFLLARGRPGAWLAAALFAVGPPIWLLTSTIPHSEALFLPLFLGSVWLGRENRLPAALAVGCLATATRHAGVFLAPILLVQRWQRGERRPLVLAACGLPALALPLLELYFRWRIPGHVGMLSAHVAFWAGNGNVAASHFGVPFRAILHGFASAAQDPIQADLNGVALLVVTAGLVASLLRRELDLAIWAAAFLALTVSLDGPWAFPTTDRSLLPAVPVALLALARLRPARFVGAATLAGLLAVSLPFVPFEAWRAVQLQTGIPFLEQHIDRVAGTLHGGGPIGLVPR